MIQQIDQYAQLWKQFEAFLQDRQPTGKPDSLYEPIRYINDLGGKRIRPLFVLLAYRMWHADVTPALPAALALEYFHNFSLLHDDIMDEAPLRRGKATVHEKFGTNTAILSGDAMLIQSYQLMLEAAAPLGGEGVLCSRLSEAALEICEGQQRDMEFEKLDAPSEEQYLEMIRQKTAVLLGLSLETGGRLAGADLQTVQLLYQIGQIMGVGFQIQDDFLDVFGDPQLTGKQKGGDILRGKKNYPYVLYYNSLPVQDRSRFCQTYLNAGVNNSIDEVLSLYEEASIEEKTKAMFQSRFSKGLSQLDQLPGTGRGELAGLFQTLMQRKF